MTEDKNNVMKEAINIAPGESLIDPPLADVVAKGVETTPAEPEQDPQAKRESPDPAQDMQDAPVNQQTQSSTNPQ